MSNTELQKHLSALGKKGGATTKKKYGPEHYREMQRRGTETKRKRKKRQQSDNPSFSTGE